MGVGVGVDGKIYFAANLKDDVWAAVNAPPGGSIWAEIYFPTGLNVVTFRPATMALKGGASPCPDGYTLSGTVCYSNCPAGYVDSGDKCIYTPTVAGTISEVNTNLAKLQKCSSGNEPIFTGTSSCLNLTDGTTLSTPPLKEVFMVTGSFTRAQAVDKCVTYGAHLASASQLAAASTKFTGDRRGIAEWYTSGWIADPTLMPSNVGNAATNLTFDTSNGGLASKSAWGDYEIGSFYPGFDNGGGNYTMKWRINPNGLAGATCYGVKPPLNQFPDILPANKTFNTWNQVPPCPAGSTVSFGAMCASSCPAGLITTVSTCLSSPVPKTSVPSILPTCPSGYDMYSNTCYGPCPANSVKQADDGSANPPLTRCYTAEITVPVKHPKPIKSSNNLRPYYKTLPNNTGDQSITMEGVSARYIRVQPPLTGGDGYINFSQIMVLDANGTNIAKGKRVTASSSWPGTMPASGLTDGSTDLREATRKAKYATATVAPVTFQTLGINRAYPSSVNLGVPISVTSLAEAQAKALANPGATGFSMTSGSSPTAQLMTITASTPSTPIPPKIKYTAPSGGVTFTTIGTNLAYDNSYKIGSPISVSGLADAQAKALATPGCSGFSITTGSSPTAQLMTITASTPSTKLASAYRLTNAPPSRFNLAAAPTRSYTLAPTPPPNWTVLWNSDYRGLGELSPPTSLWGTVDQVKAKCLSTPGCNAFAYVNNVGYLKNIVGDERISAVNGVTTYRLIDNDPNWTVNPRLDYAGQNDLPPFSGVRGTVAQVKAQCLATPGCTAFGYINGTGYLKSITLGVGTLSPSAASTYSITAAIETAYHNADPNWEFAANSDYGAQGMIIQVTGSLENLKERCLATPGCNTVTMVATASSSSTWVSGGILRNIPPGTGALVKIGGRNAFRLKDSIQTPYFTSDPNWTFRANSDYAGQGNLKTTAGNLDQVKAVCLATPGCNTFTYYNNTAQLKNIPLGTGTLTSTTTGSVFRLNDTILQEANSGNVITVNTVYTFTDRNWTVIPGQHISGQGDISSAAGNIEQGKAQSLAIAGCTEFVNYNGINYFKNIPIGTGTLTPLAGATTYRLTDAILRAGTQIPEDINTVYSITDPNWVVTPDQHHNNQGDIGSFTGTVEAAKAKCLATPGCTEFAYGWGTAYLKSMLFNTTGFSPMSGVTTYALSSAIKQQMENSTIITPAGAWASATGNRTTEFVEVDLGSNMAVASVRILGRSDHTLATSGVDRMTGVQVEAFISTTYKVSVSPTRQNIGFINLESNKVRARYIRVRPASAGDGNGDGYINISQLVILADFATGGPYPFATLASKKPLYVTSSHNAPNITTSSLFSKSADIDSNLNTNFSWGISADPKWTGSRGRYNVTTNNLLTGFPSASSQPTWQSGTPNRESEYLEIDLGSGDDNTGIWGVVIYGNTGLTSDRMTNVRVEFIQEPPLSHARLLDGYSCPDGAKLYFSDYKTIPYSGPSCVQESCPPGSTKLYDTFDRSQRCAIPMKITLRDTQPTPPACPSGTTQVGNLCYSPCPAGKTDTGNNSCLSPNVNRTQGPAPTTNNPILCNPPLVYAQSINMCVSLCPAGTTQMYDMEKKQVTCTKDDVSRAQTPAVLSYACNADEILQNGVCVSKCPDGTAPDGEICVSNMKVIPLPAKAEISCTSSPYKSAKKWMCDSPSDYSSLITNPTKTTTYVSPADEVCVTDDPTTKMYYCVSGAEAKAGKNPIESIGADFAVTCATITKRYTDLSNNLTNLIKIQNGLRGGSTSLGSASTSLANIYNQIGCSGASGPKGTLCEQIQNASSSVKNNASSVSTTLSIVIPSLQQALDTKSNLLGFKTKFQCPE